MSGANGPSGVIARDPSGRMAADGAPHEPDPGAAGPPGFEEARGRRRDGIHSPGLPTSRRRWASASEGPRRSVAPWRLPAPAGPSLDLLLDVLAWRFATARAFVAWLRGHPEKNSGAPPVIS